MLAETWTSAFHGPVKQAQKTATVRSLFTKGVGLTSGFWENAEAIELRVDDTSIMKQSFWHCFMTLNFVWLTNLPFDRDFHDLLRAVEHHSASWEDVVTQVFTTKGLRHYKYRWSSSSCEHDWESGCHCFETHTHLYPGHIWVKLHDNDSPTPIHEDQCFRAFPHLMYQHILTRLSIIVYFTMQLS